MSRALVIKNADFSVNKLGTITIEEEVPCTGITLNKSTLALTTIGSTDTLIATPAPSDTTDAVVWSTSNADVVTVAGGVVSAIGCGTATITATCGNHYATCSVTVTHVVDFVREIDKYLAKSDSKDYLNGGDLANYAIGYDDSEITGHLLYTYALGKHPIPIPAGANKIEITAQGFKPYGFWMSSTAVSAAGGSVALAYASDSNFAYNTNIADSRSVDIPDRTSGTYEGMDACAFVFRCTGTITQEAVDAIVVEFTA